MGIPVKGLSLWLTADNGDTCFCHIVWHFSRCLQQFEPAGESCQHLGKFSHSFRSPAPQKNNLHNFQRFSAALSWFLSLLEWRWCGVDDFRWRARQKSSPNDVWCAVATFCLNLGCRLWLSWKWACPPATWPHALCWI